MPNWPARMDEAMTATFLGVSQGKFRENWKQKATYPQPVREGRRLLWSRVQLERWVETQFRLEGNLSSQTEDGTWENLA
jgi:hypothetical protein